MPINDDDLLLINDGTETQTITFAQFKDGSMLNDTDKFLINDGTKTETVTWAQIQEDAGTAPVIDSVTLAEDTPETKERFTNQSFTSTIVMAEDGKPASTKSIRGWVLGEILGNPETDEITGIVDNTVTSYVWSDNVSPNTGGYVGNAGGTTYNGNATSIFDGSLTTAFGLTGSKWTIDLGRVITGKKVELAFSRDQTAGGSPASFTINGINVTDRYVSNNGSNHDLAWVDITDVGPFQFIEVGFVPPSNFGRIGGIRVDGVVLVDGAALPQPPTLQFNSEKDLAYLKYGDEIVQENASGTPVYSAGWTGPFLNENANGAKSFDGNVNSFTAAASETGQISTATWSGSISFNTSCVFKIFTSGVDLSSRPGTYLTVNGTSIDLTVTNDYDITSLISSPITSIEITTDQTDANTFGAYLAAIVADGAIVVDGTGLEPRGTVGSVTYVGDDAGSTENTITLATSTGTWGPANDGHYAIGPETTVEGITGYLKLDPATLVVDELSSTETPFTPITTLNPTISFGATLGTAGAPDDILPIGMSIQTEVKAANGIAPDSIVKSNRITPISVSGPQATMHGLRFDSQRSTSLQRGAGTSSDNSFTFSTWLKRTSGDAGALLSFLDEPSQILSSSIAFSPSGDLQLNTPGTSFSKPSGIAINTWAHVVLSRSVNGDVEAWVNGTSIGTQAGTAVVDCSYPKAVGRSPTNVYSINGYMSDLYFVDGQDLPPETFGADFEGKWGPLDSSVVKTNVDDFGTNGFFLPFDPAAKGRPSTIWSDIIEIDNPHPSRSDPEKAFDGTITQEEGAAAITESTFTEANITLPISYQNSTIRVWIGINTNASSVELICGDKSSAAIQGAGSALFVPKYLEVTDATGDEIVVSFTHLTGAGSTCYVYQYIVDDVPLIDGDGYNSIGVDASGNGNHFTDENFNVGQGLIYTGPFTSTNSSVVFHTGLFDGNLDTAAATGVKFDGTGSTTTAEMILSSPITTNGKITVVFNGRGDNREIGFNDETPQTFITGVSGDAREVELTCPTTITKLVFVDDVSAGASAWCLGLKVDDTLLIDSEPPDTVLDTPMKSYAVLETGANGNLEATAGGTNVTYMGEAGTDYYYEVNGVPAYHAGGTAFSSGNSNVYNFGQQPFTTEFDSSRIWSTGTTINAKAGYPSENLFDGNSNTLWVGKNSSFTPNTPIPVTQKVEVNGGENAGFDYINVEINGVGQGNIVSRAVDGWTTVYAGSGNITKITIADTRGNSYDGSIYAIKVDGKVLCDTDAPITFSLGNELFQTWEEWNNVVTLRANNPEDVAKFEAIKQSLENYEGDLRQFRADVVRRLVVDGFSIRELDALNVVDMTAVTTWAATKGYEDGNIVTHNGEYWFALSSSYNNSPDDNDPEDWISLGDVTE